MTTMLWFPLFMYVPQDNSIQIKAWYMKDMGSMCGRCNKRKRQREKKRTCFVFTFSIALSLAHTVHSGLVVYTHTCNCVCVYVWMTELVMQTAPEHNTQLRHGHDINERHNPFAYIHLTCFFLYFLSTFVTSHFSFSTRCERMSGWLEKQARAHKEYTCVIQCSSRYSKWSFQRSQNVCEFVF